MSDSNSILFEDIFEVNEVNLKGKSSTQFKNVSRIFAKGVTYLEDLVIDIQSEIFPMKSKEKFSLALASTLDMSGKPDTGFYNQSGEPSLLDKFDYGMHGKVFRYEYESDNRVAIYASFGGLLMKLVGDQRTLTNIELDANLYCLIKKADKE